MLVSCVTGSLFTVSTRLGLSSRPSSDPNSQSTYQTDVDPTSYPLILGSRKVELSGLDDGIFNEEKCHEAKGATSEKVSE
jgi:hypothetical protein